MSRYSSTLSPIKINPAHHKELQEIAEELQSSTSQLVRQAINEFLIKRKHTQGKESV
jgi:predicted transcriptional regulator